MTHSMLTGLPAAHRLAALGAAFLLLSACASSDQAKMTDAVAAPLSDLNLVNAEIPATLLKAQEQPYALAANADCTSMAGEIRELDAVLGPDLDTPPNESNPGLIERGGAEVNKAAIGAVRSATESLVPFRSWVRKLSGAERYSRKVAAAIAAGTVRRAFLKGVRVARSCA